MSQDLCTVIRIHTHWRLVAAEYSSVHLCPTVPHRVLLYTCVLRYLTGYSSVYLCPTVPHRVPLYTWPYSTSQGTSVHLCPTVPHRVPLYTWPYSTSQGTSVHLALQYLTGYLCTPVSYSTSQGTSVHLCPTAPYLCYCLLSPTEA